VTLRPAALEEGPEPKLKALEASGSAIDAFGADPKLNPVVEAELEGC
jgi:hypothetical protein